ncbi:hypothetical protein Pcinc_022871 [Petrolisthes cinctipes]|uniref:Uncharacterized protein n=1 Tax=Petrolisthes cinctipes TaxID=88211 RepID=A0AAE1FCX0_PETCI|nr:hypothetical protein Pcinc_022871 [Petrolisthes cinctipes]
MSDIQIRRKQQQHQHQQQPQQEHRAVGNLRSVDWVSEQPWVKQAYQLTKNRYVAVKQMPLIGLSLVLPEMCVVWWWTFLHNIPWPAVVLSTLEWSDGIVLRILTFTQQKVEWWWDVVDVRVMWIKESILYALDRYVTFIDNYLLLPIQDKAFRVIAYFLRPFTSLYKVISTPPEVKKQQQQRQQQQQQQQQQLPLTRSPVELISDDDDDDDNFTDDSNLSDASYYDPRRPPTTTTTTTTITSSRSSSSSNRSKVVGGRVIRQKQGQQEEEEEQEQEELGAQQRAHTNPISGSSSSRSNNNNTNNNNEGRLKEAMYRRVKKELRVMRKNSIRFSYGIVNYARQVVAPRVQPYANSFQGYCQKWVKDHNEIQESLTPLKEAWQSDKPPVRKVVALVRALFVVCLAYLLRLVKGKRSRRTRSMRSESLRRRTQQQNLITCLPNPTTITNNPTSSSNNTPPLSPVVSSPSAVLRASALVSSAPNSATNSSGGESPASSPEGGRRRRGFGRFGSKRQRPGK